LPSPIEEPIAANKKAVYEPHDGRLDAVDTFEVLLDKVDTLSFCFLVFMFLCFYDFNILATLVAK
jgi:hypothetical protein